MLRRVVLFLLVAISCAQRPPEVRVFAAASLTDALTEIGRNYERETGQTVVFNFAASSTLARQIRNGAPADLFLSADEAKMDLVEVRERASVLSNTLVIAGDGITSPRDLVGKTIALAEPSSVPAGIYAKEYLTRIGLWDAIAPNVVPVENVRAALAAVKAGNVEAAIVYETDIGTPASSPAGPAASGAATRRRDGGGPVGGTPAFRISDGPKISYPFAILRDAPNPEGAKRFFDHLRSRKALDVFARHGFVIL